MNINQFLILFFILIIFISYVFFLVRLSDGGVKVIKNIMNKYLTSYSRKLIYRFFSFLFLYLIFFNIDFKEAIFFIILLTFNRSFLCSEEKEECLEEDEEDLSK